MYTPRDALTTNMAEYAPPACVTQSNHTPPYAEHAEAEQARAVELAHLWDDPAAVIAAAADEMH
jgi:hypothetical protein